MYLMVGAILDKKMWIQKNISLLNSDSIIVKHFLKLLKTISNIFKYF